jgi:L-seryl-tRNA(Ser) seleniumtransferase
VRPPSVDALARSLADTGLPHPLLVDAARDAIAAGDPESARQRAEDRQTSLLRPVINATGVLLHTNLGRAPLGPIPPAPAVRYSNLELDDETGRRGSRQDRVGPLLARLVSADAALVVNNGAGAVLLAMAALAAGREVIVSRGELVEIGGGFRIPEVMDASGARLVEVGTTNRTRLDDYRRAIGERTALVVKVHPSNYRMSGFTGSVAVAALTRLGVPVVADLGSGLLDAACRWLPGGPPPWLSGEPAALQTLAAGAAVVTFSGDKLLGGPQAGIVAGRAELVERCARHPLARALRPGGMVLGALQDTLLAYLRGDGQRIPLWVMVSRSVESLEQRAAAIVDRVGATGVETTCCESVVGGGSLPGVELPSAGLRLAGDHRDRLLMADPPVVTRVSEGATVIDLRTVDPSDDPLVARAIAQDGPGGAGDPALGRRPGFGPRPG